MDFHEIWNTVNVRLVNVISPDKLCVNVFKRVLILPAVNFPLSPYESDVAIIIVLHYRAACERFLLSDCSFVGLHLLTLRRCNDDDL